MQNKPTTQDLHRQIVSCHKQPLVFVFVFVFCSGVSPLGRDGFGVSHSPIRLSWPFTKGKNKSIYTFYEMKCKQPPPGLSSGQWFHLKTITVTLSSYVCMHNTATLRHIHSDTHTHTHTHSDTHTRIVRHIQTHTHSDTHTRTWSDSQTHTHSDTYTNTSLSEDFRIWQLHSLKIAKIPTNKSSH